VLSSLGAWLPATPGSETDLFDFLSKTSKEGGVKADLVAYEGIVGAIAENQECLNRLSALLSAIAMLCSGQTGGVTLFQRDAASTGTTSVFTFCG
jgi:hypothetical protein